MRVACQCHGNKAVSFRDNVMPCSARYNFPGACLSLRMYTRLKALEDICLQKSQRGHRSAVCGQRNVQHRRSRPAAALVASLGTFSELWNACSYSEEIHWLDSVRGCSSGWFVLVRFACDAVKAARVSQPSLASSRWLAPRLRLLSCRRGRTTLELCEQWA